MCFIAFPIHVRFTSSFAPFCDLPFPRPPAPALDRFLLKPPTNHLVGKQPPPSETIGSHRQYLPPHRRKLHRPSQRQPNTQAATIPVRHRHPATIPRGQPQHRPRGRSGILLSRGVLAWGFATGVRRGLGAGSVAAPSFEHTVVEGLTDVQRGIRNPLRL